MDAGPGVVLRAAERIQFLLLDEAATPVSLNWLLDNSSESLRQAR